MRSRGLVVAIAVVLAVLAAAGVIVYTNNLRDDITTDETTAVIVANQDIGSGTILDPLIDQGVFGTIRVPNDALVEGAVVDLAQLEGQTTSAPIYTNEQIPLSRLATGQANILNISEGHIGLGLELNGPQTVNGYINTGDQIVVYATFPENTAITKESLKFLLSEQQIQKFFEALQGGDLATLATSDILIAQFDFTMTLMPSVKVLAIQNPTVDETSGRRSGGGATLVLDMLPEDAQMLVFAQGQADLYLGLLPPLKEGDPDTVGHVQPGIIGIPIERLLGVTKA
jgi:Flp pilus assembly protein CpaB